MTYRLRTGTFYNSLVSTLREAHGVTSVLTAFSFLTRLTTLTIPRLPKRTARAA